MIEVPITRFDPKRRFVGAFLPGPLLRLKDVAAGSKIVYARMAQYSEGGLCWAKQETLAEEVGMTRQGVQKCIDQLVVFGLLRCLPASKGDRLKHRSNTYEFLPHAIWNDAPETGHPDANKVGTTMPTKLARHRLVVDKTNGQEESPPQGPPLGGPVSASGQENDEQPVLPGQFRAFLNTLGGMFAKNHPDLGSENRRKRAAVAELRRRCGPEMAGLNGRSAPP